LLNLPRGNLVGFKLGLADKLRGQHDVRQRAADEI
jgi:hypothetical protein